jgi:hypothetical protein
LLEEGLDKDEELIAEMRGMAENMPQVDFVGGMV